MDLVLYGDHLLFPVDDQLGVENLGMRNCEFLLLCHGESLRGDADLIGTGGQGSERILPSVVGFGALFPRRAAELDDRAGDDCARGVGDRAAQARRCGRLRPCRHK